MSKVILLVSAILLAVYAMQFAFDRNGESADERSELVPITSADEVLAMIRQGKQVVFVDAREPKEWREERIPGAINISLRDVPKLDSAILGDPDLIVAYCLKDFRGLEVAKALADAGFSQAGILGEFGINGWKHKGLPTTVAGVRSDQDALAMLHACANDSADCTGDLQ